MFSCKWALLTFALWSAAALAQTDEIQVYDAEIAAPGQVTLTVHNNFALVGRKRADFPGGIVPDHSLNGVTEWALGLTDWWEIGFYGPAVYTLDGTGHLWFDGIKARALFVSPGGAARGLYYGCNFELSYNRPQWSQSTWGLEIRPIAGMHLGRWELTLNPILDIAFNGSRPDFAPCLHVLHHFSKAWAVGVELYEDFGSLGGFAPASRQQQTLFAVVDHNSPEVALELGLGAGLTQDGSDPFLLKLIVSPGL